MTVSDPATGRFFFLEQQVPRRRTHPSLPRDSETRSSDPDPTKGLTGRDTESGTSETKTVDRRGRTFVNSLREDVLSSDCVDLDSFLSDSLLPQFKDTLRNPAGLPLDVSDFIQKNRGRLNRLPPLGTLNWVVTDSRTTPNLLRTCSRNGTSSKTKTAPTPYPFHPPGTYTHTDPLELWSGAQTTK